MMARAIAAALSIIERDDRFMHFTGFCGERNSRPDRHPPGSYVMTKNKFCKTTPCKVTLCGIHNPILMAVLPLTKGASLSSITVTAMRAYGGYGWQEATRDRTVR